MTDTTEFAAGIPYSERTRLVAEARPDLIETLERAAEEFYRHEDAWQEEAARHQRAAGMPKRSLESPHGRTLRQAATAVTEKFEELLAAGAVTRPPVRCEKERM